eukprot:TRINITY_DN2410_c0_g1_i1.p1 TRINITY_DN2410_c0_g1~~TRINITY_DN2410_c0_g1_i1.p1  ORF type:complete len:838 (+),score=297.66 TRINITY_DN2410_c0_g1_i1:148-2661(+)
MSLSSIDPAFKGIEKKAGLTVWRIENFVPVLVPKETHGTFFSGDSYIVLHAFENRYGKIEFDVFFWLGKNSTQDEKGAAAYKTVELDDALHGAARQYREVEGYESDEFFSAFRGLDVKFLDGGVDSGFRSVKDIKGKNHLLHVKGRFNVRVREVECNWKSLNQGDVFILDAQGKIFVFNGSDANRMEKAKGLDVVVKLRNEEYGAKASVVVIDGNNPQAEEAAEFWTHLGGYHEIAAESDDDALFEKSSSETMYRLELVDDEVTATKVAGRPSMKQLETTSCMMLDCETEVFVWVGKESDEIIRRKAMVFCQKFMQENDRPEWAHVSKEVEKGETPRFKDKFVDWKDVQMTGHGRRLDEKAAPKKKEAKAVDVDAMHSKRSRDEDSFDIDKGSKVLKVYRVEDLKRVDVPEDQHGRFYSGDSYVIHLRYETRRREYHVVYFWQGKDSSQDEKAASALFAKKIDDDLGGAPMQVRVVQGKEPLHFLSVFDGHFVVLTGGHPSGFKNREEKEVEGAYRRDSVALFHIRGTKPSNVRAMQVEPVASRLNSGDVFFLQDGTRKAYCWIGGKSSDEERAFGAQFFDWFIGDGEMITIEEGEEPDEFWESIGGKQEYADDREVEMSMHTPRLFWVSDVTGRVVVEEVHDFSQDDLLSEDVFILDVFSSVFVWVGKECTKREKESGFQIASDYVKKANDARDPEVPIIRVDEGHEPKLFTCNFLGWTDGKKASFEDPYELKLKALMAEKSKEKGKDEGEGEEEEGAVGGEKKKKEVPPYSGDPIPYAQLRTNSGFALPEGCDVARREAYLSDDEFKTIFKMTREEFAALKDWKKKKIKKDLKLF